MDLQHINSKVQWPQVDKDIEQQLTVLLGNILSPLSTIQNPRDIPDLFEHVTVGFNSTMAAIEDKEKPLLAVFVCKQVLGPQISSLFELPSVALGFKLVQLPPHTTLDLAKGVIAVRKSLNDSQIKSLTDSIADTSSSWVYSPASLAKRQKNPNRTAASTNTR